MVFTFEQKPTMKSILLALFICTQTFGQNIEFKGKLLDAITKEAVVYASISFLDNNKGIYSTENGTFSLKINQKLLEKRILISCLNYKDMLITASDLHQKIIFLQPKTYMLNEIVVNKVLNKKVILDKVKRRIIPYHSTIIGMVGKYFPNSSKNACCNFIQSVTIHFPKRRNKKSKFRVRIFDRDSITGLPNKDMLTVNIPITIGENDSEVFLDLSNYSLEMPKNGFFVAFEKLLIPFNHYNKKIHNGRTVDFYSPVIGITKSKEFPEINNRNYLYYKGTWIQSPKVAESDRFVPAISVTLSN